MKYNMVKGGKCCGGKNSKVDRVKGMRDERRTHYFKYGHLF